jgi:hypothetical protein
MDKPKGGRGKRVTYKTSVVRVPNPIVPQVLELIDQFHASQSLSPPKTNSIEKIPALSVNWFHKTSYEPNLIETEEEYIRLSNLINRVIWQIDNTFTGVSISNRGEFTNAYEAVDLLLEYRLIELPKDTKIVSAKHFAEWLVGSGYDLKSIQKIGRWAFDNERYDIVKTVGILDEPPIADRKQYWHHIYHAQLGKPYVDFWQWARNPESREIARELTILLSEIPEPYPFVKLVLMKLAHGKNPFLNKEEPNNSTPDKGSHKSWYFEQNKDFWKLKEVYRTLFIFWHEHTLQLIGQQKLLQVYRVVFSCSWTIIQEIVQPKPPQPPKPVTGKSQWWDILGVSQYATHDDVKAAYKLLAKQWHPDTNKSPSAAEMMKIINSAMDFYKNWQNL